jgi:hypothetical protein
LKSVRVSSCAGSLVCCDWSGVEIRPRKSEGGCSGTQVQAHLQARGIPGLLIPSNQTSDWCKVNSAVAPRTQTTLESGLCHSLTGHPLLNLFGYSACPSFHLSSIPGFICELKPLAHSLFSFLSYCIVSSSVSSGECRVSVHVR